MPRDEIEVPKGLREFMPERAEETILGKRNGARRQYRYGNLHIREYDDRFLVHTDRVDPRKDPMGHLVCDAPEVLAGLACAALGSRISAGLGGGPGTTLASSLVTGCLGYLAAKKIKDRLE